jgi:hypothetical protein
MGTYPYTRKVWTNNNGCATSDVEFNATICHIHPIVLYVYLTYDKFQKNKNQSSHEWKIKLNF